MSPTGYAYAKSQHPVLDGKFLPVGFGDQSANPSAHRCQYTPAFFVAQSLSCLKQSVILPPNREPVVGILRGLDSALLIAFG